MSDQPDSGPSSLGKLSSEFLRGDAPAMPEYETVINPERRAAAEAATQAQVGSSLWKPLFPMSAESPDTIGEPDGFELGHFRVEKRIGSGGMGSVFRAVDERLQRVVALKVLAPAQSRDRDAVQRFRNEARAAAQLDHDNIARVFYIGEDKGLQFIAYEFVRGTNLRELIKQVRQLEPAEAINYTLQIASALNHTSAAGVIHRDIKPSNIIIAPNGRAKLVDLGLARKQHTELSGDLTLAGTTLGTFDYISPEQAKDPRNVDVRSDIYSLGCTLYHMLAGEPPYPEGTMLQKLLDHQGSDPPDPAVKNRRVPPNLSAVVRKMMASDLRRRYANPDELIRELMLVAGTMGLGTLSPEGLVWTPRPSRSSFVRRNAGWLVTAAILLVTVAAIDYLPVDPETFGPGVDSGAAGFAENESENAAGQETATEPEPRSATDPADNVIASDRTGQERREGNAEPEPAMQLADAGAASSDERDTEEAEPTGPAARGEDGERILQGLVDLILKEGADTGLVETLPGLPEFNGQAGDEEIQQTEGSEEPKAGDREVATVDPPPSTDPEPQQTAPPDDPNKVLLRLENEPPMRLPTLEAACRAAKPGNTIELLYNGIRPGAPEKPIRITNKRLTIQAGRDETGAAYAPVLRFDPGETPSDDDTRMFTLADATLELVDVAIEYTVRDAGGRAALATLQDDDRVELRGVNITMLNPDGREAAVFEVLAGPSSNMSTMMTDTAVPGPAGAEIFLDECFVRGSSDLIVLARPRAANLRIEQTLLALGGRVVAIAGDRETPDDRPRIDLRLEDVTAALGEGLLELQRDELQPSYTVAVTAENSVFALAKPDQPLIHVQGGGTLDELRALLTWDGRRNYYDGVDSVWSAASVGMLPDSQSNGFEEWTREHSEAQARNSGLAWPQPWRGLDFATITPEQLQLTVDQLAAPPSSAMREVPGADPDLFVAPSGSGD